MALSSRLSMGGTAAAAKFKCGYSECNILRLAAGCTGCGLACTYQVLQPALMVLVATQLLHTTPHPHCTQQHEMATQQQRMTSTTGGT